MINEVPGENRLTSQNQDVHFLLTILWTFLEIRMPTTTKRFIRRIGPISLVCLLFSSILIADPIQVLVWDEQQPHQKTPQGTVS